MLAVLWRHNANSPWNLLRDPQVTDQDARATINQHAKYDMAKREYRVAPLGDADTWVDPFAEQAAREAEQDASATDEAIAFKCNGCGITVMPTASGGQYCTSCTKRPVGRFA